MLLVIYSYSLKNYNKHGKKNPRFYRSQPWSWNQNDELNRTNWLKRLKKFSTTWCLRIAVLIWRINNLKFNCPVATFVFDQVLLLLIFVFCFFFGFALASTGDDGDDKRAHCFWVDNRFVRLLFLLFFCISGANSFYGGS